MDINADLLQCFTNVFNKKSATAREKKTGINFKYQQLTEKWYKPIIRKLKKSTVYSSFKDNI